MGTKPVPTKFSIPNYDTWKEEQTKKSRIMRTNTHGTLDEISKISDKSHLFSPESTKSLGVQYNSPSSPHKKSKIATGTLTSNCILARTISPTKKEKFTFFPKKDTFETTFDPDTSDASTLKRIQRVEHREVEKKFEQFKTLSISERDNKPKFRPIATLDQPTYLEHEKNVNDSQRKMRNTEINNWD